MKTTILILSALLCGCTTTPDQNAAIISAITNLANGAQTVPIVVLASNAPPSAPTSNTPNASTNGAPLGVTSNDFAAVRKWYGAARGDWPETVKISNARVSGGHITWQEDTTARRWNVEGSGKKVNAEVCFVVPSAGIAGRFDDCGPSQTKKTVENVLYLNAHESGMFAPWNPKKGDRVGLYLTTLNSRREQFKMRERSNVTWFTWP